MITVPAMPEHMSCLDAGLSQGLGQWVDPVLVSEESVRHRGLEDACLDQQPDGILVVRDGAIEVAGRRSELEKQGVRISSGALIPVDDHGRC
jgi:hypothetical protein